MSSWMDSVQIRPTPRQAGPGVRAIIEELDIAEPKMTLSPEPDLPKPTLPKPQVQAAPSDIKARLLAAWDRRAAAKVAREEEDARLDKGTIAKWRRVALIAIAIGSSLSCAAASIYFSRRALVESQPPVIATIMALTIVATLTVAPELSVSLARRRKRFTSLVVSVIAAVATVFSMSQTVQGIYSSTTARIEEAHKDAQATSIRESEDRAAVAQVSLLQDRKARLEKSLQADEGARDVYQEQISARIAGGEAPDSRAIALLVANRNAAQARVTKAQGDLAKVETELVPLLARSVAGEAALAIEEEKRDDFFSWVAGITGLEPDTIEFALAVFPAIFIDIIAPAMLVVAFAL